jgi:hypothetical protein
MGALHKAWKGYVIAKNKDEYDKTLHYADIIQECQDDLGLRVSSFHNIGKSALAFHSLRAAQYRENMANKIMITTIIITNTYQKLTSNTNKKGSLTHIVKVLEMIIIKRIGSLMIMPIVKILQMIIINQIDLLHTVIRAC